MNNTPYHKCIFTIRKTEALNDAYHKDGRQGEIIEYRSWSTAHELLIATHEQQPLLVLFSSAQHVGVLLYYAIIDEIRITLNDNPKQKSKTKSTVKLSNMKQFEDLTLHTRDLFVLSKGGIMSNGQIHGYTICRTPSILLKDKEPLTQSNAPFETRMILRELTGISIMGNGSIFMDEKFGGHGPAMQVVRHKRMSKEISDLFKKKHDLNISTSQIHDCETCLDLEALVIRTIKLKQAQ